MLFHQNYFQHNILEAGAHGPIRRGASEQHQHRFSEPPPTPDKRIFQAELFYDVTHPVRHKITKATSVNVDNFKTNSNVDSVHQCRIHRPAAPCNFG